MESNENSFKHEINSSGSEQDDFIGRDLKNHPGIRLELDDIFNKGTKKNGYKNPKKKFSKKTKIFISLSAIMVILMVLSIFFFVTPGNIKKEGGKNEIKKENKFEASFTLLSNGEVSNFSKIDIFDDTLLYKFGYSEDGVIRLLTTQMNEYYGDKVIENDSKSYMSTDILLIYLIIALQELHEEVENKIYSLFKKQDQKIEQLFEENKHLREEMIQLNKRVDQLIIKN